MTLPIDFQFSQGSLQDYVDCPRRFQLRYLLHVAWPAVQSEPVLENERHREMGAIFHRLVYQYSLGIPVERLSRMAASSRLGGTELETWWQNYLSSSLIQSLRPAAITGQGSLKGEPFGHYFSEISLAGHLCGTTLTATYDALWVATTSGGNQVIILDWKTNRKRQKRAILSSQLQTRVYQYLIVSAGAGLNGGSALAPAQIEMIYWFAGFPDDPECFAYSTAQYETDTAYLSGLIEAIRGAGVDDFPNCIDQRPCKFCVYRSLCERGVKPGDLRDEADEVIPPGSEAPGKDIDFDQITEIEF